MRDRTWKKRNWERHLKNERERLRRRRKKKPSLFRAQDKRKYERRKAHPEKWAKWLSEQLVRTQKHRAAKRKAVGSHTKAEWVARIVFYGWRCFYCKCRLTPETVTKDHRIPASKGGSEFASNLVPACGCCNSGKGANTYYRAKVNEPSQSGEIPCRSERPRDRRRSIQCLQS